MQRDCTGRRGQLQTQVEYVSIAISLDTLLVTVERGGRTEVSRPSCFLYGEVGHFVANCPVRVAVPKNE